jgi:hypothetical protein
MATDNPTAPNVVQFPYFPMPGRSAGCPAPCPFCGNARLVKIWADDPNGRGDGVDARVQCGACLAEGPVMNCVPNAVRAWNVRREVSNG